MTTEEKERILGLLPEKATDDLIRWTWDNVVHANSDLGDQYLIANSIRTREAPMMYELFNNIATGKSKWISECYCTACGERTYTDKWGSGIILYVGDDGNYYANIEEAAAADYWSDDEDDSFDGYTAEVEFGEEIRCPLCQEKVYLASGRKIRDGRTFQLMLMTLERVDRYGAVVLWLASRSIGRYGSSLHVSPAEAYIIDDGGKVVQFSHMRSGGMVSVLDRHWRARAKYKEPNEITYSDYLSINNRKRGYQIRKPEQSMVGTTVEKTGLHKYLQEAGVDPIAYLKLWRKHPEVENLINAGFAELVDGILETGKSSEDEYTALIQPDVAKPHEMLRMTKQEMRHFAKYGLRHSGQQRWIAYTNAGGGLSAIDFLEIGDHTRDTLLQILEEYWDDVPKVERYLKKQGLNLHDARLLLDAREMAENLYARKLTEEELWPRNLQQTHDRLADMVAYESDSNEFQKGFDKVCAMLAPTVYTDGELLMTLPTCNGDLIREGNVLRHCVGGYGHQHADGVKVILFVRHARRPERPYYTLNISLKDSAPKEIQLHGYGNERHGDHKQHSHRIPKKVRDFCDYWEREVLAPYWKQYVKEHTA